MANFKGTAKDIYTMEEHIYPAKDISKIKYHFDFIFTKRDDWYYISSSADADAFEEMGLHKAVEENDEQWKVVNAISGQIIKERLK